jgi:hypothetical protein
MATEQARERKKERKKERKRERERERREEGGSNISRCKEKSLRVTKGERRKGISRVQILTQLTIYLIL